MARVFPKAPYLRRQWYQDIYLPLLHPLFLCNWLFILDCKDFFAKVN